VRGDAAAVARTITSTGTTDILFGTPTQEIDR
jgi:hypothetical protein